VNDLEEQLRGSLERLAGPVVARVAPEGIRARVRRRRIGVALVAACTSLALAGAAVAVIRRPVPSVVVPTLNPYRSLPPGWPAVDTTEDPGAVVAGTVDGVAFRLTATTADGGDPCLHLLVHGERLGTLCGSTSDAPVPTRADLDLGVLRGGALGDLRAHLGFVSERTASLVAFYDGIDHPMPVFAEPDGWNVRPFLFFPPPRFDAWVDAVDDAGNPLAETSVCGSLHTQMGCIRLVDQVAVIPGRYTPPPPGRLGSPPGDSWEYLDPIVRAEPTGDRVVDIAWGGSFTPYVDREVPSPVSGKKIVVTYGRAGGLEFALAVYDTNGRTTLTAEASRSSRGVTRTPSRISARRWACRPSTRVCRPGRTFPSCSLRDARRTVRASSSSTGGRATASTTSSSGCRTAGRSGCPSSTPGRQTATAG
jgi:hypothetical protein